MKSYTKIGFQKHRLDDGAGVVAASFESCLREAYLGGARRCLNRENIFLNVERIRESSTSIFTPPIFSVPGSLSKPR